MNDSINRDNTIAISMSVRSEK